MTDASLHPEDLERLLSLHLDGGLDPADAGRLRALIADDPDALDLYIDLLTLDADTRWSLGLVRTDLAGARSAADHAAAPAAHGPLARLPMPTLAALAAALLFAAAAVAVYLAIGPAGPAPQTPDPHHAGPPVATVLDASPGSTLVSGERIVQAGAEIPTGDLALDRGSAEFRLVNGVGVTLRGKTGLRLDGPMSATLTGGAVDFDCPPVAAGYTVHLPNGLRVTDLGTRFGVDLDDDAVWVTDGEVRVSWPGRGIDTPMTAGDEFRFADDRPLLLAALALADGGFEPTGKLSAAGIDAADLPAAAWAPTEPGVLALVRARAQALRPRTGHGMLALFSEGAKRAGVLRTVTTVPDQTYELRFHLARQNHAAVPAVDVDVLDGPAGATAPRSDRILAHQRFNAAGPSGTWSDALTVRFVARSAATTLRLIESADSPTLNVDPFIDDVSLFTITPLGSHP